jgi:hypothetical protein
MKNSGLVWKVAIDFKRNHPNILSDVEDLVQEGFSRMDEIRAKYEAYPKKDTCKFSTFLKYRLKFYYFDLTRNERKGIVKKTADGVLPELPVTAHSFPPAFLESLSEDARRFVEIVIDGPKDFIRYIRKANNYLPFKFAVGNYLGFSKKKVKEIEEEVKNKFIC